ncbi:MAG TPA: hypothetical protein VNA69_20565 [Thermoanaerobaculia bacterium]|nr:hypothetical protein [Thermoanaerobaculia bacterium]
MTDRRDVVYLLHGVDSGGAWYPIVSQGLEPFFRCAPIRYGHYDAFGKWKVATLGGGFAFAIACILLLLVLPVAGLLPRILFIGLVLCAVAGVVASIWEIARRRAALRTVAFEMNRAPATGTPVRHVIAHSFGTYLFGKLLEKAPATRHDRVVLVGSILPRDFDWMAIWQRAAARWKPFRSIRNEHSARDFVVGFAGRFRLFAGRCGTSGLYGFLSIGSPPLTVHDVSNAWGPCPFKSSVCASEPILHNHDLPTHDHNAWFLKSDHARMLWMPFLWGLDPADYIDFVYACHKVEEAHDSQLSRQARLLARFLHGSRWSWFTIDGEAVTMSEYAANILWAAGLSDAQIDDAAISDVIYWTAIFVATAHWGDFTESNMCANPGDALATAVRKVARAHGAN